MYKDIKMAMKLGQEGEITERMPNKTKKFSPTEANTFNCQ